MKSSESDVVSVSHTPGPWTLETVKTQVGICHKIGPFPPARANDEPSHACIYVDGRYKATDDPESLANARVIAAAPDLLEACNVALAWIGSSDRCPNLKTHLETVIAKATPQKEGAK